MTAPSASLLEGGFFWRRHRSTVEHWYERYVVPDQLARRTP